MKIGFDISQVAHFGGVATYTKNLAAELSKIPNLEMKFFYSSLRKPYSGTLPHVKSYPLPPTLTEILFNKWRLFPIEQFIGPIDIFHSSDWMQPKTKAKKVTTYHDVVPLKYPEWSHPKIVAVHKKRLILVEKEIDMVIAVSEFTKKELIEVSKIPEKKITVVYEAAGEQFKPLPLEEAEQFKKKLKLPENFILSIGGIGERRNLKRAKEAAKDYNLVITGETMPAIPDEQMPLLYNAASVLLYPSLYEGFGLPILESMACGTPVITSNLSAIPEVGGNAVIYVKAENVEDISKNLKSVMSDEELRNEMRSKGLEQAQKFSWKKAAQETRLIYENLR